jgi:hypothetical protein
MRRGGEQGKEERRSTNRGGRRRSTSKGMTMMCSSSSPRVHDYGKGARGFTASFHPPSSSSFLQR